MVRRNKGNQEAQTESEFLESPVEGGDWISDEAEEMEGQLAVDVFQTKDSVIIKAPIAGVKAEDIDIAVHDGVVTVRGERKDEKIVEEENYFVQECYWGAFSRSVILPAAANDEKAKASLKDGVLTVEIPKAEQEKVRKIKVSPAQ